MVAAVVVIHIVVCVSLVIVILLQQGKGAEVGAVFGGSSQTVFGASGAGNVLTKVTWALAAMFFRDVDIPGAMRRRSASPAAFSKGERESSGGGQADG